jgi:hypothetical protein
MRIPRHVIRIVEIDKTILERWGVENRAPHGKQGREKKDQAAFGPPC